MKALVFAAGLGTRLAPFTLSHPKALVDIAGKPMLQIVIERLQRAGATSIVVNVHHFASQIVDFIASRRWSAEIIISDETDKLRDTGGGIVHAARYLAGDEPFIVHNADILTDLDLRAMYDAMPAQCGAMLLATARPTSRYLLFDSDNRMHGWTNVATGDVRPAGVSARSYRQLAFGGIHVVGSGLLPDLERYARDKGDVFSITDFYIDRCAAVDIRAYCPTGDFRWFDVGRNDTLQQARDSWR